MKRFALMFVAPTLALLAVAVAPIAVGSRTLYLRDALNTHLPMKWMQAEAMRRGELPLVDVHRGGGQPHLGNPNTVPLYPDNLLYLAAPPLWAFNAHFWLHLLIAPAAFYAFARAWGVARGGAWLGGVCYAGSGYFLSQLNLYNLVAGTALAPAFAAALLALTRGSAGARRGGWRGAARPGPFAAVALLWALLLLAGDPVLAVVALALAATAALSAGRAPAAGGAPAELGSRRQLAGAAAALALGTLAAAPQIVEFLRILPLSFRGHWGYSSAAAAAASWNPLTAIEWLIPFSFGPPSFTFWGQAFYAGQPPLYYNLYPGVLAIALAASGGLPRGRAAWWAWGAIGAGLFFALGSFNPLVEKLLALPGASLFRFPVKLWLWVACGASLLGALAGERLIAGGARPLRRAAALLAIVYAAAWMWLTIAPEAGRRRLRALIPDRYDAAFVEAERLRWAGLCLFALALLAAALAVTALARRRGEAAVAVLAALHLGSQLFFLRPLLASDETAAYREPPAALAAVPVGSRVAHGSVNALFGQATIPVASYPDPRLVWLQRQTHRELYPWAGVMWGRRYDYNLSPEGLDSFLTRAATEAMPALGDTARLRLLAAGGVDRLLLTRDLAPDASGLAELAGRFDGPTEALRVYRLPGAAREVELATRRLRSPHLNASLALLTDPSFDPSRMVVLPLGAGAADTVRSPPPAASEAAARGSVSVVERSAERIAVDVEVPSAGAAVVWSRAWLPIYRATVDGRSAAVAVANLDRIAIEVPPGRHRVVIATDRRPFAFSTAIALLALVAIAVVSWRRRAPHL